MRPRSSRASEIRSPFSLFLGATLWRSTGSAAPPVHDLPPTTLPRKDFHSPHTFSGRLSLSPEFLHRLRAHRSTTSSETQWVKFLKKCSYSLLKATRILNVRLLRSPDRLPLISASHLQSPFFGSSESFFPSSQGGSLPTPAASPESVGAVFRLGDKFADREIFLSQYNYFFHISPWQESAISHSLFCGADLL